MDLQRRQILMQSQYQQLETKMSVGVAGQQQRPTEELQKQVLYRQLLLVQMLLELVLDLVLLV